MKVFIALSLVILAVAQEPMPCGSPPQWQAREISECGNSPVGELLTVALYVTSIFSDFTETKDCSSLSTVPQQDYQRRFFEFRKLYYDETNRRIREIEEIMEGSTREFHDRLYLYNENKNYSINLRTRSCNVSTLMRPFHYRGVHPNARFDGYFNIGAVGVPGENVLVQAWSANETNGEFYTGLATSPDCYPIQTIYFSQMGGFYHSEYIDLSVGITDLNVFVPPQECVMAEAKMKLWRK